MATRSRPDLDAGDRPSRTLAIVEAVALALVAVLAAWSGFVAARFGTESRLQLARAATARAEANRAQFSAEELRNFDASTFNTWFTAIVVDNQEAADLAVRRFRPAFKVAFDAWLATDPMHDAGAPPGPTFMPEYVQPDLQRATELTDEADRHAAAGSEAAGFADDYVRTTVILATVLFLVGISGHFRVVTARVGLLAVAGAILIYAVVVIAIAPQPPG